MLFITADGHCHQKHPLQLEYQQRDDYGGHESCAHGTNGYTSTTDTSSTHTTSPATVSIVASTDNTVNITTSLTAIIFVYLNNGTDIVSSDTWPWPL